MYNTTTNTTNLGLFATQHEYCSLNGYDPLKQCCLLGLVLIGAECIAARMYFGKFPESSGCVANLLKTVKLCLTTATPIAKDLGSVLLSIAAYYYDHVFNTCRNLVPGYLTQQKGNKENASCSSVAYITIGRWEPPHKGHEGLIKITINAARDFNKNKNSQKWPLGFGIEAPAVPYIWVSKDSPINADNPLTTLQKLYYLKRMFPKELYPDLIYVTDLPNINIGIEHLMKKCSLSNNNIKILPGNAGVLSLSLCHKYMYFNILDWQSEENGEACDTWNSGTIKQTGICGIDDFKNDIGKIIEKRMPSKQCIVWLSMNGVQQISIVVGSDQVKPFEQYNRRLLDKYFPNGGGTILQGAADRGDAGRKKICLSAGFYSGTNTRYSGTNTRHCANNWSDEKMLQRFLDAVLTQDMTILDGFCLLNSTRFDQPDIPAESFLKLCSTTQQNEWNDIQKAILKRERLNKL